MRRVIVPTHSIPYRLLASCALAATALACGGASEPDRAATTETAEPVVAVAVPEDAGVDPARAGTGNGDPMITRVRLDPETPMTGQAVRATVEASDPDGDPLFYSFRWTLDGNPIGDDAPRVRLDGAQKGSTVEVVVVASDGKGRSTPRRQTADVGNTPPRLAGVSVQPGSELVAGTPIFVRPDARDPDQDSIEFRYRWWVDGEEVSNPGPKFETDDLQRGSTIRVSVVASDGESDSEPVTSPELSISNTAPKIATYRGTMHDDGVYRYDVDATDSDPGDQDNLQFHLTNAPQGMEIDHVTGEISWAPTSEQAGTTTFAVVVDDLHGGRTSQSIEVTVSPAENQPVANAN